MFDYYLFLLLLGEQDAPLSSHFAVFCFEFPYFLVSCVSVSIRKDNGKLFVVHLHVDYSVERLFDFGEFEGFWNFITDAKITETISRTDEENAIIVRNC